MALQFKWTTTSFGLLVSQPDSPDPFINLTRLSLNLDYELGRLYDLCGDNEKAKAEYSIVLSGKIPEVNRKKGSGKVSLQVSVSFHFVECLGLIPFTCRAW